MIKEAIGVGANEQLALEDAKKQLVEINRFVALNS